MEVRKEEVLEQRRRTSYRLKAKTIVNAAKKTQFSYGKLRLNFCMLNPKNIWMNKNKNKKSGSCKNTIHSNEMFLF